MAATPNSTDASTADTMVGGGHHYCIIADSGRQYRVSEGQELEVDFRPVERGSELVLDKVLAVSKDGKLQLGTPLIDGAVVKAEVLGLVQGEKIYIQKFRRRKNYRRRTGHRSVATKIRISEIPTAG
ncbi:MAG: ribosomal protein [Planctomycetota bacterium]